MRLLGALLCVSILTAFADPASDIVANVDESMMVDNIKYLSGVTSDIDTRYSPAADALLAQDWLRDYFEGLGYQVTIQDWGTWSGYACCDNVIARKEGTKFQAELYVICGHYDSISNDPWNNAPGADDNGTGAVSVMEAARLLQQYPTDYTIEFICFSGEEEGLYGSSYYCNHPGGRLWQGAINLDMVGYAPDPNHEVYVGTTDYPSTFAEFVAQTGELHNPGRTFERFGYSGGASDNYPFYLHGVPECLIIEGTPAMIWGGYNPYYHRTTDTWDHINPTYLRDCARTGIAALAELAGASNGSAAVLMPQYVGGLANVTIELERRDVGSITPLATYYVALDSAGVFELPDEVPAGTWDFAAKAPGWLRDVSASVTVPTLTGTSFHLVPGDCTADNRVDLLDINTILVKFGSTGDPNTDIDGSGVADLDDLNIVLIDFGEVGDP
jgi:hypothetical protein